MPPRTKFHIGLTLVAAVGATAFAAHASSGSWIAFWLLLFVVLASSGLKVTLPHADGSMSLNFPFILLGIVQLSPLQALLLTAFSVAAQCRIRTREVFPVVQAAFNVANAMLATGSAYWIFASMHRLVATAPALALASVAYFVWNTGSVAVVLASSQGGSALKLWRKEYPWYLPFYLVGAVLAAAVHWMSARFGWGTALLLIPFVYTLYRAYMSQVTRVKERQAHLEETRALQRRTIEGLAMAIEAKDQNTHDHLFRVRHYVNEVGQALQLSEPEMEALETAAFLHDIGKLAIPENILNKPGKLTPEEFEKMKIHPGVGADILERVRFPYPVVPIVRSHHEWWNGMGYPDGLRGTAIPIGARILTVVDCFDAMVSDRPYRKGMSPSQALGVIRSMSAKQFDPAVVEAFEACYAEAEKREEDLRPAGFTPLNTELEVWRGLAPGAGFEAGSEENVPSRPSPVGQEHAAPDLSTAPVPLDLLAAASQEAQSLFELSQSLGGVLTADELFAVMVSRLQRLLPFQIAVLYVRRGGQLEPRFVTKDPSLHFRAETMPLGDGVSGWVAQSGKALLNGNAALEPGCPLLPNGAAALTSCLAVPLFDLQAGNFAVLTFYATAPEAFSRVHLRAAQAMEPKLALSVQNALQGNALGRDQEMDFLTGLPGAKRLVLQLEAELERCIENAQSLSVIVCDLNDFKRVNDRRGQLAGNRLLQLVADSFRQLCVQPEMVGRMGGDEFVFLLPGVDSEAAQARAAEIRIAIEMTSRRTGHGIVLSGSVGTASYPTDGDLTETLLAAADRRMYLEKQRHDSGNATHAAPTSSPALALKG